MATPAYVCKVCGFSRLVWILGRIQGAEDLPETCVNGDPHEWVPETEAAEAAEEEA